MPDTLFFAFCRCSSDRYCYLLIWAARVPKVRSRDRLHAVVGQALRLRVLGWAPPEHVFEHNRYTLPFLERHFDI